MTISGTMGRVQRSKYSSPTKCLSSSQSGNTTPRSRRNSPEKHPEHINQPTTRSTSENFNESRNDRGRVKVTSNTASGYVVDTRSKTLNSVTRSVKSDESTELIVKSGKKNSRSVITSQTSDRSNSGYGKPLVTSMNKKLIIQRESESQQPTISAGRNEKQFVGNIAINRTRSPIRSLKANKESTPSTIGHYLEPTRSKLPRNQNVDIVASVLVHIIIWRFVHLVSCLWHSQILFWQAIIALGVLFWTATRAYRRSSHTDDNMNSQLRSLKSNVNNHYSPTRVSPSRSTSANKMKTQLLNKLSQEQTRKMSESAKQISMRDLNAKCTSPLFRNRNSTVHSNRSYKPQLEDIQSSFLLLNKINEKSMKKALEHGKKTPPMPRPKPVDEIQRKQQLMDVKRKFQSKQFWNETKYDKIEGLNWISWK